MSSPEMMNFDGYLKRKTNAPDTALNLAAAAAQYAGFAVLQPIQVERLLFFVTVATTFGLVLPKVAVTNRPTYGSSSGATTIGTMTIPNGAAIGKVFYKSISDNVRINAGNELSLDINVQGTDGGTAQGSGWFTILWSPAPDADANQTASAAGA